MEDGEERLLDRIEEFKKKLYARTSLSDDEKKIIFEKYTHTRMYATSDNSDVTNHQQLKSVKTKHPYEGVPFAELVRKIGFKNHTDLVLLATYDLIVNNERTEVTTSEIQEQYKKALIKASTNTSADIAWNRKKGYMMPSNELKDGKMAYLITMTGIDYIEKALEDSRRE